MEVLMMMVMMMMMVRETTMMISTADLLAFTRYRHALLDVLNTLVMIKVTRC